jgi:hypothetical protein
MGKEYQLKHGGIVVSIDDDSIEAISEAVPEMSGSEDFRLIKVIANVFFYASGTDYKQKENQVDRFNKKDKHHKVRMTVPIPPEVLEDSKIKKDQGLLELRYYDKNSQTWEHFDKTKIKKNANAWIVELKSWIKDPPVGWGGG